MKRKQRGAMLIVALFIIIVVAALGAFALRIGMVHQQTASLDLLGARAQAAADAGIEWGAYRALVAVPKSCVGLTTFALPQNANAGALRGFQITVTCTASAPYPTSALPVTAYAITATATSGVFGTPQYISRNASALFN